MNRGTYLTVSFFHQWYKLKFSLLWWIGIKGTYFTNGCPRNESVSQPPPSLSTMKMTSYLPIHQHLFKSTTQQWMHHETLFLWWNKTHPKSKGQYNSLWIESKVITHRQRFQQQNQSTEISSSHSSLLHWSFVSPFTMINASYSIEINLLFLVSKAKKKRVWNRKQPNWSPEWCNLTNIKVIQIVAWKCGLQANDWMNSWSFMNKKRWIHSEWVV